ncbi:hypothetical protein [Staphylococcus ratti]|uniref:Uncharacterized protein n=1 Tax=Staphylococcus ratti TaxID=2892440 RepID=A0ABY3PC83_9STAP|nr:hypothetical protein [Staphylococcus ratti]UEX89888.1 hypothetical protein LN051_10060 [Staphylococcus ratti]
MIFNEAEVRNYLTIVKDDNPIHPEIVPGQMVVERVWRWLDMRPICYQVKYKQPIRLGEALKIETFQKRIVVKQVSGETKLIITIE